MRANVPTTNETPQTVSLAVSPSDSDTVAVTGWPSIATNAGNEKVFLTHDGGKTWADVTGNLKAASGVAGKVRPGGPGGRGPRARARGLGPRGPRAGGLGEGEEGNGGPTTVAGE